MSEQYDEYLKKHKANVRKGFYWIRKSLPDVLQEGIDYEWEIYWHDDSKTIPDEYNAYDEYFYGKHTKNTQRNFRIAWLAHIHRNPHHWQHWVLMNDDGPAVILDMPHVYIIEMICDWWSFSWEHDNLFEIFDWYEAHKKHIKLSKRTRDTVEDILQKLEAKIIKVRGPRKDK